MSEVDSVNQPIQPYLVEENHLLKQRRQCLVERSTCKDRPGQLTFACELHEAGLWDVVFPSFLTAQGPSSKSRPVEL